MTKNEEKQLALTDFPKLLSSTRKMRGLSLRGLSQRVGLSVAYLSDIERGVRPGPPQTVIKLAVALNLNVDYLLFRAGHLPDDIRASYITIGTLKKAYRVLRGEAL